MIRKNRSAKLFKSGYLKSKWFSTLFTCFPISSEFYQRDSKYSLLVQSNRLRISYFSKIFHILTQKKSPFHFSPQCFFSIYLTRSSISSISFARFWRTTWLSFLNSVETSGNLRAIDFLISSTFSYLFLYLYRSRVSSTKFCANSIKIYCTPGSKYTFLASTKPFRKRSSTKSSRLKKLGFYYLLSAMWDWLFDMYCL